MNILFLSREYPPGRYSGGIGSYIACIAPALVALGHEVHVLCCEGGQDTEEQIDKGVHIHRRGIKSLRGLYRCTTLLGAVRTVGRVQLSISNFLEYRKLGLTFDVIEYPECGAEGWVFATLHQQPLVAHLHSPLLLLLRNNALPINRDAQVGTFLERLAVHHADAITAPSTFMVGMLKQMGWLKKPNVIIVPYPIDWSNWRDTPSPRETKPLVLSLARLERLKAPEILLQAVSRIHKDLPEVRAIFAGRNAGMRDGFDYLSWMKQLPYGIDRCDFLGQVPRHNLLPLISKSRVLVVTSWFENYPMAALEGMAGGRPVVVTENTGVAKMVKEIDDGLVIPPGDPTKLSEALRPFLVDAAYAAKVGERARETVRACLDPHKIAAQREAVYQQAIRAFHQKSAA